MTQREIIIPQEQITYIHQSPREHPFNTYEEEWIQRDEEVHGDLSWLSDQVEQLLRDKEREEKEEDEE